MILKKDWFWDALALVSLPTASYLLETDTRPAWYPGTDWKSVGGLIAWAISAIGFFVPILRRPWGRQSTGRRRLVYLVVGLVCVFLTFFKSGQNMEHWWNSYEFMLSGCFLIFVAGMLEIIEGERRQIT
jgi:hypothetical protein